jgi:hypothetical protein
VRSPSLFHWELGLIYRKYSSLRRKYGIPDNDHRPFNVAWAAVQRAQREKNIASQAERRSQTPHSTGEQTLRHRQSKLLFLHTCS